MAKYIHLHTNTESFNESDDIIKPNVTFIENSNTVLYNKYSKSVLEQIPLTFRFISDGTFEITAANTNGLVFDMKYEHIRYGETLANTNININLLPLTINVQYGDEIMLTIRTTGNVFSYNGWRNEHVNIGGTAKSIMYGNFCSIVTPSYTTVAGTVSSSLMFKRLFQNYVGLDIDENNFTFGKLTDITSQYAFQDCFKGCVSLSNFPLLPFTTLQPHMYEGMFEGCKNLKKIAATFTTDITDTDLYTKNWLKDVSPEGIFLKSRYATWENRGQNGIPSNWNVGKYID